MQLPISRPCSKLPVILTKKPVTTGGQSDAHHSGIHPQLGHYIGSGRREAGPVDGVNESAGEEQEDDPTTES